MSQEVSAYRSHSRHVLGKIATHLILILAVIIALTPVVWVFISSFKTNKEILSSAVTLPKSFSLQGYRDALALSPIPRFFLNSVIIATISTVLIVLVASMAAYIFERMEFRGKNAIYGILMASMVIPMTALIQPVFSIISWAHLTDTMTGLIIVYAALNLSMSILIMRTTFSGIPRSLEQAAYVDGAGFFRSFFAIVMPSAKAGLSSAAVLAFLNNWNEFTFALILTRSTSVRTLPLSLNYFTAQFSFNLTAMFAAIVIAVLPSILIFSLFQEQVVNSMTAGAVKG